MRAIVPALVLGALQAVHAGVLPEPCSLVVAPEYRSAYQARGLIIEDRPVAIVPVFFDVKAGDFGAFGLWSRTLSSLSDRKEVQKSQWFYERDWALRWRYELPLFEEWSLRTTVDKVWMTFWNYRAPYRGSRDHTLNEWRLREELRNPYLTPFVYFRRGLAPTQIFYAQLGVAKGLALADDLTLTPQIYVETGNRGLMQARYGSRVDGEGWRGGIQTGNFRLDLNWRINATVALYAGIHQFCTLNDHARDCVKAKSTAWSRRDLTIYSFGARFTF